MERIHVDVPEQPPVGSVVLDSAGTAWQCHDMRPELAVVWTPAHISGAGNALRWAHLLTEHGPLDVVHRAEAT